MIYTGDEAALRFPARGQGTSSVLTKSIASTRNPKSEAPNPKQIQNLKSQTVGRTFLSVLKGGLLIDGQECSSNPASVFRASDLGLFRISDFVLRISSYPDLLI
jgi:hypothetical protein